MERGVLAGGLAEERIAHRDGRDKVELGQRVARGRWRGEGGARSSKGREEDSKERWEEEGGGWERLGESGGGRGLELERAAYISELQLWWNG